MPTRLIRLPLLISPMLPGCCIREPLRTLAMLATAFSAACGVSRTSAYASELALLHPTAKAEVPLDEDSYAWSGADAQLPDDVVLVPGADQAPFDEELPGLEAPAEDPLLSEEFLGEPWRLRWLPGGLIYHSYMAGVHEPRMGLNAFGEDGRTLWDATLGGRVGFLQYGNGDPFRPAGYQLDFYGAAIARLDVDNQQDLDATDYVFGLPFTWGDEQLQFKFGYAHISSHLGDELAIRVPATLAQRVNYVRDSLVFGTSYYPYPAWRVYGEVGYAFHTSGGAKPLETQFGTELSKPGPSCESGSPFLAINARLREEHDFGGDISVQAGWMRRGILNHTLRFGLHYYNGKSSQFQFFDVTEEQIGLGLWYDF